MWETQQEEEEEVNFHTNSGIGDCARFVVACTNCQTCSTVGLEVEGQGCQKQRGMMGTITMSGNLTRSTIQSAAKGQDYSGICIRLFQKELIDLQAVCYTFSDRS